MDWNTKFQADKNQKTYVVRVNIKYQRRQSGRKGEAFGVEFGECVVFCKGSEILKSQCKTNVHFARGLIVQPYLALS